MTKHPHARTLGLSPETRDALADFARAYLHEDLLREHGSATGAASAFAADASPKERHRVIEALDRVAQALGDPVDARLARSLWRDLRCAWTPAGGDDVVALAAAMRAA